MRSKLNNKKEDKMKKVELKRQDVTKKLLEDVAGEFNTIMNYEVPIATGKKVNKEQRQKRTMRI